MTQTLATVICCSVSITVRSLIFGVAYDDTVVGLEKVQLASEKFSEIVKTKLEPEFSFSFEKVGGKTLFRYLFTSGYFPDAVSYNRFVELMPRVFFHMMLFMKLRGFGKCSGISFVDSTMIPVCHNLRRYANKVFKDIATDGKGTMGWCHGLRANMKNRLMSMWDKIMLRKRCIIECINDLLKNKANIVHSRHRSIHNFIMNIYAALTAYSFFENKPEALPVHVEKSNQLNLF